MSTFGCQGVRSGIRYILGAPVSFPFKHPGFDFRCSPEMVSILEWGCTICGRSCNAWEAYSKLITNQSQIIHLNNHHLIISHTGFLYTYHLVVVTCRSYIAMYYQSPKNLGKHNLISKTRSLLWGKNWKTYFHGSFGTRPKKRLSFIFQRL